MSGGMRKRHEAAFKAKVSLEAIKEEERTLTQLASDDGVHANQIGQGRRQLFKQLPAVVSERRKAGEQAPEEKEAELYRQIGQLKVEVEWWRPGLRPHLRREALALRHGGGGVPEGL